ncbi:protein disulphide isomerase, putative [Perkinsus marinus ATCC 50983]|uniref:Protein disulphide isomerase, putative n=1 Tax=Perkinsus marinus (strain ATCC 50983 / TXsc) TaxID=423536 RepID=C5LLU4_PERM5|nr:protein disulphide isomerase, putative [Perkinsus marinus ATCC 50983]EER02316.1 protein disulphide isomerase, putative [Perkinsus marinus ATCC 50983]|eukprot:XP_002769598.1 protein disulphide isomerase, putative [Perkinsus marinus ATCC 50983]
MQLFFLSLICLLSECTLAGALYGKKGSFVQVLDAQTFTKTVVQSNELWVVEFYADWCGHCQQFAPEYKKAASALAGIVNLAAVNDQPVMGPYGVQGFPTVRFFGEDKSKPVDYSGPREAKRRIWNSNDPGFRVDARRNWKEQGAMHMKRLSDSSKDKGTLFTFSIE